MSQGPDPVHPRINRFLARAGLGSRRAVEELIRAGRVSVDGEVVADMGRRVDPHLSRVDVDGKRVSWPEQWRIFAFHKPAGVITSLRSQGGLPCLDGYARGAQLPPGTVPVGRLDVGTSGLLIWTDDGVLHQALCRPRTAVWKRYEMDLNRPLGPEDAERLRNGSMILDGRPCLRARLEKLDQRGQRWSFAIHEGRNRQIRRMIRDVGLRVTYLHRLSVGGLELGNLQPGEFRELKRDEASALRRDAATND